MDRDQSSYTMPYFYSSYNVHSVKQDATKQQPTLQLFHSASLTCELNYRRCTEIIAHTLLHQPTKFIQSLSNKNQVETNLTTFCITQYIQCESASKSG